MKNIAITRFFLAALIVLGISSCGSEQAESNYQEPDPIKVTAQKTAFISVPVVQSFPGRVVAESSANLSTKLMGQIYNLKVEEGDQVRQGQTIASIRSAGLQAKKSQIAAQKVEAEAALSNAKKDFERIKSLFEKGSTTQKELDDISTQISMGEAKLSAIDQMTKEVEENLRYANITAPFDGQVTKRFLQNGDMAAPGQPILTISSSEAFKIVAKVPENEVAALSEEDMPVSVTIDAAGLSEIPATVSQLNATGGRQGGQYEITVRLSGNKIHQKLREGMFAQVNVSIGQAQQLLVPKEAIVKRGQLNGVYTINMQEEALLRWVRLGKEKDGKFAVLSGLGEGDRVILTADGRLSEGTPVKLN